MTSDAPTAALRWRDLFASELRPLTIGIICVEVVSAVESSVVTTIMPDIARDLGGLQFYGLVFSGYVLASLASTQVAGAYSDRYGPLWPFALMLGVFVLGTIFAALAPSMPVLAAARIVQGWGGSAQYTIAYGVVATNYPSEARSKMLALLSAAWVVPGLLSPSLGAALAGTVGWRWAFLLVLPLAACAAVLLIPVLSRFKRPASASSDGSVPIWLSLQLAVGVGILLAGLAWNSPLAIPAAVVGVGIAYFAARRLLPPGTISARRGLPAVIAIGFLANLGFFTGWSYIPLLVTAVGGRTLAEAGLAITLSSLAWALGAWWQQRVERTVRPQSVALGAAALLGCGLAASAAPIANLPAVVSYVGFALASAGMGVVFQTLYLLVAEFAPPGGEVRAVAALQVANRIGICLGSGLGGAFIGIAITARWPVSMGLIATFGLAVCVCVLALPLTSRLPDGARYAG